MLRTSIYNLPVVTSDRRSGRRGEVSVFRNELKRHGIDIVKEMADLYLHAKQNSPVQFQFDVLCEMAKYVFPRPALNINVTPGEAELVPPELADKSVEELEALLPEASNDGK